MPIRIVIAACLATACAACAGTTRLSETATTANIEVADLQIEVLLLNIVRRSMGHPIHFTTLAIIRERPGHGGRPAVLAIRRCGPGQLQFSPQVTVDQGPTLEIATQRNQEF